MSDEFPDYLPTLVLTSEDLRDIASKQTPDAAKQAMLDNLDNIQEQLPREGAVALAKWADRRGLTLSGKTLQVLATQGGYADPKAMIGLLGQVAATLDLDSMKTVLNALKEPYSLLSDPGRKRPKIPISNGADAVLARLQQEQIVSRYTEDQKAGVYTVSKKHR